MLAVRVSLMSSASMRAALMSHERCSHRRATALRSYYTVVSALACAWLHAQAGLHAAEAHCCLPAGASALHCSRLGIHWTEGGGLQADCHRAAAAGAPPRQGARCESRCSSGSSSRTATHRCPSNRVRCATPPARGARRAAPPQPPPPPPLAPRGSGRSASRLGAPFQLYRPAHEVLPWAGGCRHSAAKAAP